MPLKLTCPHCRQPTRLTEPLPLPGGQVQCEGCRAALTVTYPQGVMEDLKRRGKQFVPTHEPVQRTAAPKSAPSPAKAQPPAGKPSAPPPTGRKPRAPAPPPPRDDEPATSVDRTWVDGNVADDPPSYGEFGDRTIPSARTPYGGLPNNVPEPESARSVKQKLPPTDSDDVSESAPTRSVHLHAQPLEDTPKKASKSTKKAATKPKKRWWLRLLAPFLGLLLAFSVLAAIGGGVGFWYFSKDLPSTEALQAYDPPTVTVVYDRKGRILGEIYEERRYVVPLDEIPEHVQHAFLAAEDAGFWDHGGVDYMGIVRAVLRNAAAGKKAQGASTITQQVARNFLLTKEKTIVRKIKEILLAWRIEDAYTKEHILYLYLNEIYLGSSAYGVEAASQVYFGKSVRDIDVAEAAILAGLPQRPSDYSPHRNFDSAKVRQAYVLGQMVKVGYLTQAEADAAAAEQVVVVERTNPFLEIAPHFTEYARRHLVAKYGEQRVLHEGLQVTTTCDLDLQTEAQKIIVDGVDDIDQRMGFRRSKVVTLSPKEVVERRKSQEAAMKKAWAKEEDPAGRIPEPAESILKPGRNYEGVLLEVEKTWAKVGIGSHEAIIPLAWSDWVYAPNPGRSWRNRDAKDLTESVDSDGDGIKDGSILRPGDLVEVRVEALSTREDGIAKAFAGTPGASKSFAAARLWQDPEVEASLLSYELDTGAVRAMVGGADFRESQFNRTNQSTRQVGSTFKPIVYGAAIDSRRVTAASIVADAPLAFATGRDFIWKPGNYGNDFEGNMTLRRALALSKNTCTVRVIESTDPGMNKDVVYRFARKLGIGGQPTYAIPEGEVRTPENDHLCPWIPEERDFTVCTDRFPAKDPNLSDSEHRARLKPGDKTYLCRACDYSMALGSASLTMEELLRAYSAFGTGGKLIEPYYIEEVRDRDGNVLERHTPVEPVQVIEPGVATIVNWLLQGVVHEGTASAANKLGLTIAGKTGTTNDEKDAWFVGLTPKIITGVWVGFDQPQSLGVSSTGGRTALPLWMKYMEQAAPKPDNATPFKIVGDIEWAQIDEATGRRVTSGGRSYPFLAGTVPEGSGVSAGQLTIEDLVTEM